MENSNYNLFVAVATGQGVSNLPPILQYAKAGDEVLWLVSQEAEDNKWAESSMALLNKDFQIKSHTRKVIDLYSPKAISKPVVEFVEDLEVLPAQVLFVLNGGPKLTPLGLFGAGNVLAKRDMDVCYLHGSDKPCMLRVYDSLTAEAAAPPCIVNYSSERMLSLRAIAKLKKVRLEGGNLRWQYGEKYSYDYSIQDMSGFYRHIEERKDLQGSDQVGPMFEKMVFERIVRFFHEHSEYKKILKEVNAQVGLWNNEGNRQIAELDVAITLMNGIVLSFECKSGGSSKTKNEVKDLNSRVFELRRASSSLGRMWVVVPFFPESTLFEEQKKRVRDLEFMGFQCLSFTPPENFNNTTPPSFELKLNEILKGYLPTD